MTKLPVLTAKQVIHALEKAGFYIHHQRGSHVRMLHSKNLELKVTIPYHSKDIPRGTLHRIIRQAGLIVDGFLKLL